MVGTLVLIGEGKWTKSDLKAALAAKDRTKGGMTAPAGGLYLVRVDYV
jgi:tRNA pseudouridine38-40 synthase